MFLLQIFLNLSLCTLPKNLSLRNLKCHITTKYQISADSKQLFIFGYFPFQIFRIRKHLLFFFDFSIF